MSALALLGCSRCSRSAAASLPTRPARASSALRIAACFEFSPSLCDHRRHRPLFPAAGSDSVATPSHKRAYPEGEVDEHKESDNAAAAAGSDSGSSSAAAAAAASPAKRPRVEAAAAAASGSAAAAAPSASSASSRSILPPSPDRMACSICMEALESSAKGGAESASRVPRSLPCGHSCCTGCIQKGLDANGGSVGMRVGTKCEQRTSVHDVGR